LLFSTTLLRLRASPIIKGKSLTAYELRRTDIMEAIFLQIPPEIAAQIKIPPKRAQRVLMEELVLRLYEEGIISAGQGAYLLK
jgi:hypothetical protein